MEEDVDLMRVVCAGLACTDFDACQKCFPKLQHPRHLFVRIPATGTGEIEVVLNGMPHAICDGCGVGWGGMAWMCACIQYSKNMNSTHIIDCSLVSI